MSLEVTFSILFAPPKTASAAKSASITPEKSGGTESAARLSAAAFACTDEPSVKAQSKHKTEKA